MILYLSFVTTILVHSSSALTIGRNGLLPCFSPLTECSKLSFWPYYSSISNEGLFFNSITPAPPSISRPNPPTNLNVTIISKETARIRWDPPSQGHYTSFRIKIIPLAEPEKPTNTIVTKETSYYLPDLTTGATYQIRVNTELNGRESAYVSTNITTKPNTPGRFIVWFRNETTLLVLWQPPYPAGVFTDYKVSIDPPDAEVSETYVPKEGNPAGPAQAAFIGLVPGKAYNITVSSISEGEISDPTTAQYRTVPLRPMNVTFDTTTIGTDFFSVKWRGPHNKTIFDRYQVAIGIRRNTPQIILRDQPLEANITEDLKPGRTYQVVVKTVSGSVASWPATGNVTTRPLPVTDLYEIKDPVTNKTKVAWKPHPDSQQDKYKVTYIGTESSNVTSGSVLVEDNYFTTDILTEGKNYNIVVQAISNGVESQETKMSFLSHV